MKLLFLYQAQHSMVMQWGALLPRGACGGMHNARPEQHNRVPIRPSRHNLHRRRKGIVVHGFGDELLDYITGACYSKHAHCLVFAPMDCNHLTTRLTALMVSPYLCLHSRPQAAQMVWRGRAPIHAKGWWGGARW